MAVVVMFCFQWCIQLGLPPLATGGEGEAGESLDEPFRVAREGFRGKLSSCIEWLWVSHSDSDELLSAADSLEICFGDRDAELSLKLSLSLCSISFVCPPVVASLLLVWWRNGGVPISVMWLPSMSSDPSDTRDPDFDLVPANSMSSWSLVTFKLFTLSLNTSPLRGCRKRNTIHGNEFLSPYIHIWEVVPGLICSCPRQLEEPGKPCLCGRRKRSHTTEREVNKCSLKQEGSSQWGSKVNCSYNKPFCPEFQLEWHLGRAWLSSV